MARNLRSANERLKWFRIEEDGAEKGNGLETFWIYIEDFIQFLRDNRCEGDLSIRTDNIQKEFDRHEGKCMLFNGKKAVKAVSIFRYLFHHYKDSMLCQLLCNDITQFCTKPQQHATQPKVLSTKHLYDKIAELEFGVLYSSLANDLTIANGQHINDEYANDYPIEKWKLIQLFELDFDNHIGANSAALEFESLLSKKWVYFQRFQATLEVAKGLQFDVQSAAREGQKRQEAARALNGFLVNCHGLTHIPFVLEDGILEKLSGSFPDVTFGNVIALGCHSVVCDHEASVHVMVEVLEPCPVHLMEYIAIIVRSFTNKYHGILTGEVLFVTKGSTETYKSEHCRYERLRIFDDVQNKSFSSQILYVSPHRQHHRTTDLATPTTISISDQELCRECFKDHEDYIQDPLAKQTFSLDQEWFLHVPMTMQIILESMMVNCNTLRKQDPTENDKFLRKKLQKLYSIFEQMVNSINKRQFGIIQEMNTEELTINSHSISTVFNVTSKAGVTKSLKAAENQLKRAADAELCYYNTYVRRYPLFYRTIASRVAEIRYVSMRECHIIIFMDNLVRLTVHTDPNPGENRTSQLCTLPLTLKGLPKDNAITAEWHNDDCDGLQDCNCKDTVTLKPGDYDNVLKQPLPAEREMLEHFDQESVWGLHTIWAALTRSKLKTEIEAAIWHSGTENAATSSCEAEGGILDLDESFSFLHIGEDLADDVQSSSSETIICTDDEDQEVYGTIGGIFPLQYSDDDDDEPQMLDMNISKEEDQEQEESNVSSDALTFSELSNTSETSYLSTVPVFEVPPLLYRHPPPETGRDDDKKKLAEILDDCFQKLGTSLATKKDRILFAPDHKIGANVLSLMAEHERFQQMLPEFPILHAKKSKITSICSAYEEAGLHHLLMYMTDDNSQKESSKLMRLENIELAAKINRRLSLSIHFIALILKFLETLPPLKASKLSLDMSNASITSQQLSETWGEQYRTFIESGSRDNASFALHCDICSHCDEVVGLGVAERLGGPNGYNLLLGLVKRSLPFAFLNGACAYGPFTTHLLYQHYSAGTFHANMKMCLYSTPHKDSQVNFALDTQREIDHIDALKGFRPRSTLTSVVPRMTQVDSLLETQKTRRSMIPRGNEAEGTPSKSNTSVYLGREVTETDIVYILRTAPVIIRQGGLDMKLDDVPRNVYHQKRIPLHEAILDKNSTEAGHFLLKKYAVKEGLFGFKSDSQPSAKEIVGPKELVRRVSATKSTTIQRSRIKEKVLHTTELEKKEAKRQQLLKRKNKEQDSLSSASNACQALLEPDCGKGRVNKSLGIRKAILFLFEKSSDEIGETNPLPSNTQEREDRVKELLQEKDLIHYDTCELPDHLKRTTTVVVMEFAGVKFKGRPTSGNQYIQNIKYKMDSLLSKMPNTKHVVICEEKYSFTPDTFKAATREKRKKKEKVDITHLKKGSELLSLTHLDKGAVISTCEGKYLISNFLASNVAALNLRHNVTMDIDSEFILNSDPSCTCPTEESCVCPKVSTPIRATFSKNAGFVEMQPLQNIPQRKGEAELSQMDWLVQLKDTLDDHASVASIVTSGDIDTLVVHLFGLSIHWPRNPDGKFKNTVYLLLEKPASSKSDLYNQRNKGVKFDCYNVTKLIEEFEVIFSSREMAVNLAVSLCLGGNDFLPNFSGVSHKRFIEEITKGTYLANMIDFQRDPSGRLTGGCFKPELFLDLVKNIYCPKSLYPDMMSFDEVRQISVKAPGMKEPKLPKSWMPPQTAVIQVTKLVQSQVDYLFTAGYHDAPLPNFLGNGCLEQQETGEIVYNLGPDHHVDSYKDILLLADDELARKMKEARKKKPQTRAKQRKRPLDATPRNRKRRANMSTPKQMRQRHGDGPTDADK